jgi:type I restriction enzyme S subunit
MMSGDFKNTELSEVAGLYDSLHQTPQYTNEGYPMIRVTDIRRGYVDTTNAVKVDEATYLEFSKKHKPKVGDILFSRVGSYGNSAYVNRHEEFCLGQNTVCISPERSRIDPVFLYCALNSDDLRHQIESLVGGASQGTISLKSIRKLQIPLPPLPVQLRIAGILSAYDELIENNQRRIKILEEMARSLYREWFVRFRFPGHDKVKMVPSPLGPIPQGWEVRKLGEIADVNRRQINPRNPPEEVLYIDISSVSPGQINLLTRYPFAEAPGRARRIVQHGDIIWSCVRPNRRSHTLILQPEVNTVASTGFALLTATKVPFTFLYLATTTDDFVTFLANSATGAAYPAVTAKTFEDAVMLIPTSPLLNKFGVATIPMAEEIYTLQQQAQNLRRTRDLLLPRLLSGQVDVNYMETIA